MTQPISLRLTRLFFVIVVSSLLVVTAVTVNAQSGGSLRVGVNSPVVLDPALATNDPEIALNRAIYDYLVDVLPDASVAPNLATEWEVSEDGLTYTFTLRDDVTFHDGTPFTADDVVFTFERLQELESTALSLMGTFTVEAANDTTAVFNLSAANADFLYGVGSRWAVILPDGLQEPNIIADGNDPYVNFNGTGPFVLEDYSPDNRALLVANENYWQTGEPQLSTLEFVYIDDPVAQVDSLLSGELDFIFKIPNTQISRLEEADGIAVLERPTSQHAVIRLRTDQGPGADVEVRQALKLATNRAELNDILLEGRGIVGNNDPISPKFGVYYTEAANQGYDPVAACERLSDAGYDSLDFTLYLPDSFEYPDLAALLQNQWQNTGCLTLAIEVRPEGLYYDTSNPDNWFDVELGMTGWGDRPIPQQFLEEAYLSTGPFNESRWSNEELDALIIEARGITNVEERSAIYAQISQIFAESGPVIVPYFTQIIGGVAEGVAGLDMAPFPGETDFRGVTIEN